MAALLLLASACTGPDDGSAESPPTPPEPPTASTTTEQRSEPPPPDPGGDLLDDDEIVARLTAAGGRLAVGDGAELAVMAPDGGDRVDLDGSDEVVATQPTWSRDGTRLAWASLSADGQVVRVQAFDDGRPDGPPIDSAAPGNPVFYLQWSLDDGDLAYLRNAPTGLLVEFGLVPTGADVEPIDQGVPFFIAWSPEPSRLLAHVDERSVQTFDPIAPAGGFDVVATVAGGFSAPAWVDGERALVVADGALAMLELTDGTLEPIVEVGGPIRFVLSPDRTRVAFQRADAQSEGPTLIVRPDPAATDGTDRAADGLVVLELATGEQTVVTTDRAVAWEWSPDSSTIAWLTARIDVLPVGRWHFWSADRPVATGQSPEFALTRRYARSYLPFFAQYTHSVTGWSPDSSAFAFAGAVGGIRGVWIQLVDAAADAHRVASGDFVTWGPAAGGGSAEGASAA